MESKKNVIETIFVETDISKETLKRKNEEIINKLNAYKKDLISNSDKEENDEEIDCIEKGSLFEYNNEYGYLFNLNDIEKEEKEIVSDVLLKDPIFALKFLERKKNCMPRNEYDSLKAKIVSKLELK